MIKATFYNANGQPNGDIELPEEIFGLKPNEGILYQYAKMFLANQRLGTAKAKTRSEVSGSKKKPWKQKGTGRARVGTIRSPLWYHGGVIHAPRPVEHREYMPAKMKRLAMLSILSDRALDNLVSVMEPLSFEAPSTRKLTDILEATGLREGGKILLITPSSNKSVYLSARNLSKVSATHLGELNPYQVLTTDRVLIFSDTLNKMKELWAR
jgi:large subunit ribosomal protein L4